MRLARCGCSHTGVPHSRQQLLLGPAYPNVAAVGGQVLSQQASREPTRAVTKLENSTRVAKVGCRQQRLRGGTPIHRLAVAYLILLDGRKQKSRVTTVHAPGRVREARNMIEEVAVLFDTMINSTIIAGTGKMPRGETSAEESARRGGGSP
jgi:hypothetical protein